MITKIVDTAEKAVASIAKAGASNFVDQCSYPLTAPRSVTRIYTDVAVFHITPRGLEVGDIVDDLSLEALQEMAGVPLMQKAA